MTMGIPKKRKAVDGKVDKTKAYSLKEASSLVKQVNTTKFDASVDLHIRLGVDPKKADQAIRGTVTLPHGTGKTKKVLVLCPPDQEAAAKAAGAVNVVKGGKIAFKVDKAGIIHASIGRVSFAPDRLEANSQEFINAIIRAKPATAKGTYLKGLTMASSMSPGIAIDPKEFVH